MHVDRILRILEENDADYILVGGLNFLLHHKPILTYDVDLWVRDTCENLKNVNHALRKMGAEWGPTENSFKAVPPNPSWLSRHEFFCLTTKFGAVDVFRNLRGLDGKYSECKRVARHGKTPNGTHYYGLSDKHMLAAELALDEKYRRSDRLKILEGVVSGKKLPEVPLGIVKPAVKSQAILNTEKQQYNLKESEELKRERAFDPVSRWKSVLGMIQWTEKTLPPHEVRNRPRVHRSHCVLNEGESG